MIKFCSQCEQAKDIAEFAKKGAHRKQSRCKSCNRDYLREYYELNPLEKLRVLHSNRVRRQGIQQFLLEQKDKPCADCGNRYPREAMDFDHLGDKEFTISNGKNIVSRERLEAEIAKCDVVCSNCHRTRTETRRLSATTEITPSSPLSAKDH
jgi:hypothetical protein